MSLNGDNDIDYSYPEINTWRTVFLHEMRGIRHNTSGASKPRATRYTVVQERNPYMADIIEAYEREDEGDEDEDDDPVHFSRVGSVRGGDAPAPRAAPRQLEEKNVTMTKKPGKY